VASFIGSPAMNLIDGEIKNGVFTAPNTEIKGLDAKDGKVTLGFRAEDAVVPSKSGQITAPIYTLELLGDATMISVRIGGALVSAKADKAFRANIGEASSIEVPASICHLFDQQTGERIGDKPQN
jgi:multiple sugar transport system ATP-binding protein